MAAILEELDQGEQQVGDEPRKENGSKTPLSLLSNMTIPTTMMTAITLRMKLSKVIFLGSMVQKYKN